MLEKKSHEEASGHNSVPSKQTTLLCIRVAHGLPPWKIVWVMFFNWVLIRHHIFWETGHFWEFQMKETEKEINWKENILASKGKGKGNDWKKQKIMASGKQLDTIVYPPNKPHYCVPGCNFLWKASGKFQWWKIKIKRTKTLKNEKKWNMFEQQKKTKTQLCILTQWHNCVSWHNFKKQ